MVHGTHRINAAVEQTLTCENISLSGVHSSLSYDPCAIPSAFYSRSLMPRATETLLQVMLPPVQPREGMGNFCSLSQTPDYSFVCMTNCTTKAVNFTHHELIDKFFHSDCRVPVP